MSDKTEQPTPRRLRRAREQGDSPLSAALVQAVGFAVALALTPPAITALAAAAAEELRAAILGSGAALSPLESALLVITLTAPLLLGVALTSALVGGVQTGGVVAPDKLSPDLARLDPVSGLKQLLSPPRLFAVARALVAAAFVAYFTWDALDDHMADVANGSGQTASIAVIAAALCKRIAWWAAFVGLGLGAVDFWFTHGAFLERHRMSKDEVKREHRESEGDPEVKAARRRAHQEALAGAALNAVKKATVLIVNPTHLATALRYVEDEDQAPLVLAQGQGDLARNMIEAARAYGVPIVRDVPVARALRDLEVGDEIPEALYEAVAEILREIWASEQATSDEA
jgi:flagellar biosynthesis protein FlhB